MTNKTEKPQPVSVAEYGIAHAGEYGIVEAAESGLTAHNYRKAEKQGLLEMYKKKS